MKFYPILLCISTTLLFTSCEKTVDFNLNTAEPKLVIEASIENGQAPVVYISKSLDYFSSINYDMLANSSVSGAEVYISNGTQTHRLKEYSLQTPAGSSLFYYSNDPASPATAFLGQLNTAYSLRIVSGGKEYTAVSRIPSITRRIDTLYWKPAPAGNLANKVVLMIKATDPPGYGDYIRYYTKQNRDPFFPGLNSVYDDQVIDGTTYEVQVERGVPRTGSIPENYSFFDRGDTVTVKLANIDKATYDFWRTMEFSYASVGNPFSSPTKVLSNINGGALGYFGGYAAQYRTLIIPR
ncbi:MAG TPA: DUF4249 domain-containing protein [Chitinophagaceae bacterium]|nr:DUF4249 domain-containing protein [Chitinophagaceae bacterium]